MNEEENKAIDYLKNDVVYWLDKGKDFVVIDIGENEKLHIILHLLEKQQNKIDAQEMEHQYDQKMIDDLKGEMVHNWIHKDKIREKIKEQRQRYFDIHDGKHSINEICFESTKVEGAVEVLKELLEEK